MLYADPGRARWPLPGWSVALGRFRSQQLCRCSAGAHRAQAAQPAAGSRCSSGAGGHGARAAAGAAERVRDRPAWWPGRRSDRAETPGPLLRGGWAGGWGAGAASMAGAAAPPVRFRSQSRSALCVVRFAAALPRAALRLRECPTEGAPAAGLRGPCGERRAGFGGGRTYQRPTRLPVGGAAAARPEGPVPHERQAWPASAAMVTRCFR